MEYYKHADNYAFSNLIGTCKFLCGSSVGPSFSPEVARPFSHRGWGLDTRLTDKQTDYTVTLVHMCQRLIIKMP